MWNVLSLLLACTSGLVTCARIDQTPVEHGQQEDFLKHNTKLMHRRDVKEDLDKLIRPGAQPCQALNKELLEKNAKDNVVLVMAVDKLLFQR